LHALQYSTRKRAAITDAKLAAFSGIPFYILAVNAATAGAAVFARNL
jgi:hypothetical protein